ncbi:pyridoxal-5'-phosphate-dependent enzyme family protein isoform X2 [Tasmannia lanceolata]|uniref:pyridoxal-5'-phosphate-dependent enzyme family protein isoform X2 n=1 Tax=Tasmannia lanceolata TaxID=3420 RepID=UPI004064B416
MKLQHLPRNPVMAVMKNELHSRVFSTSIQCMSKLEQGDKKILSYLLDRRWVLASPDSKINKVSLAEIQSEHKGVKPPTFFLSNNTQPSLGDVMTENRKNDLYFYVVRDDLLHPLINGNKARKLDGLLPLVEDHSVTDVVTCGGCQSAHAAAVAVSCAERGLRSHLLLRGEQPEIPTGYNLISTMYGSVSYIARSLYAQREDMLTKHAYLVAGKGGCVIRFSDILETSLAARESEEVLPALDGCRNVLRGANAEISSRKVVIVNEGVIRLVYFLSQNNLFGKERPLKIVVDAGTGTTAVGLALGAICLGLPWEVNAVMLADTIEGYKRQEKCLIFDFKRLCGLEHLDDALNGVDGGIVHWVERTHPRKFGNVLKGEVEMCQQIAQQTGILVDPVYTLAAWEHAALLCQQEAEGDAEVVMLHTGGTLGMFGLAQRYTSYFSSMQRGYSHSE